MNIPVEIALKGKEEIDKYIEIQSRLETIRDESDSIGFSLFRKFEDIKKDKSIIFNTKEMGVGKSFSYHCQHRPNEIYGLLVNLESEVKLMIKESLKLIDNQRESEILRNTYESVE